jgi:hypothetical protein
VLSQSGQDPVWLCHGVKRFWFKIWDDFDLN